MCVVVAADVCVLILSVVVVGDEYVLVDDTHTRTQV